MREAALYLTGFRRRDVYGAGMDLDPQAAIDRLRSRAVAVAGRMSDAVGGNLERHGIELVTGSAVLGPGRTVVVTPSAGRAGRVLRGEVVLWPPAPGRFVLRHPLRRSDVPDSETARDLDRPMASLVVVGGGAVACEYASIFMALGADVTLIDRGARVDALPRFAVLG